MTDTGNNGRSTDGRFAAGNPGRPAGARHKATLAIEALLQGEAERLGRQAVTAALGGDTAALRLCLDRIAPVRKDSPLTFALPPIRDAADAAQAATNVLAAVADGTLTTLEGDGLMKLLDGFVRIAEAGDLEARLAALEAAASKR